MNDIEFRDIVIIDESEDQNWNSETSTLTAMKGKHTVISFADPSDTFSHKVGNINLCGTRLFELSSNSAYKNWFPQNPVAEDGVIELTFSPHSGLLVKEFQLEIEVSADIDYLAPRPAVTTFPFNVDIVAPECDCHFLSWQP